MSKSDQNFCFLLFVSFCFRRRVTRKQRGAIECAVLPQHYIICSKKKLERKKCFTDSFPASSCNIHEAQLRSVIITRPSCACVNGSSALHSGTQRPHSEHSAPSRPSAHRHNNSCMSLTKRAEATAGRDATQRRSDKKAPKDENKQQF